MTTINTCIAKKVFTMTHDAPSEESFVNYVNRLNLSMGGYGLDSLDAGDAMGYLIEYLEQDASDDDAMMLVADEGWTITISYDWELFQWNPSEMPETLGKIISDIGVIEVIRRIRELGKE